MRVLAHDLLNYEHTSQVPEGLSQHVASSKKTQAIWHGKKHPLPPKTRKQASMLVIQTLKEYQRADVEPEEVQFELQTFPVDPKAVSDGDVLTVYVDATDPREAPTAQGSRASGDYATADALQQNIADAGYRFLLIPKSILAKKYRIRLRCKCQKEAKVEFTKLLQGKCLTIGVYDEDQYGRLLGDKTMLTKGLARHYEKYDERPELKKQKQARDAQTGLWASPNPQKPWEWRKYNPRDRFV
ncbi:hypothetical protein MKX01_005180 [Papaver californicum]|nr:hypothetical protein MKX01_005180 [Papaver californicum]